MAKRGRGSRANGEGSLLRRAGTSLWYAQYYKDGRQIRTSTGTPIKAKALVELRKLMGKSENGEIPASDLKKIRYSNLREALLADYATEGNRTLYTTADGTEKIGGLQALDEFVGFDENNPGLPVTALTTDLARSFVKKRQAEGYAAATINRSLSCLRRMLQIAVEDKKIQAVPKIHFLKEKNTRKGFIELPRFQKLLAALPENLHPVILFLYWCGGRKGEAFQIQWRQVDLKQGLIELEREQTKNEEARFVPLPPILIDMLSKVQNPEPDALVFDTTGLRTQWALACEKVGEGKREKVKSKKGHTWYHYRGLLIHDLRRSAVRNLINAGIPERVAMAISGHKTRSIFDRYHIVSAGDVTNAMQRLMIANNQPVSASLVQVGKGNHSKLLRARSSKG